MLQKVITLLFLSGEPISTETLATILHVTKEEVDAVLPTLQQPLRDIGLDVVVHNGEVAIVTQPAMAEVVELFWKEELKGDLTPATLQVLTLVAYCGEPTRAQISAIRGVQSSQSIRTLSVRGLISRNGEVCTLTHEALQLLGVTKVEELPDFARIHSEFMTKLTALA